MRKSNELGFIEEDIDLGFIDDAPNLTTPIIPAVNPLELQIETERDEKEISLRKEFMAKVEQEKADADPENWTLRQVQDHLKINPPLSLPEEAQWQGLIMKKKRQIKQMMEKQYPQSEILNAPPKSIQDAVLAVVMKPFQQTPAEKNAHAQNIYALSKVYDLPVKTVTKNYEALAAEIFGRDLKPIELASISMMGPLTAALIVHPAAVVLKGLGVGLAAFQAVAEVENGVVSKVKKENYRFLRGRNIAELLPAEANQGTKDMVEMLSFIGKGFAAAGITGITKYGPGLVSRFTKDVVFEYQLPKSLYMPADAIKSMKTGNIGQSIDNLKDIGIVLSKGDRARVFKAFYQGKQVQIEVPSEVVVKLVDKPIWARIKDTLHIKPYEKVLNIIGREDNQFVGVSLRKLTGPADEGQGPGVINISSGEIEPVLASKLAAQPAAGGMTGKGIPEQVSKWMEKGVTISERQAPIKIVEPETQIQAISDADNPSVTPDHPALVNLPLGHEMTPCKLSNGKIWLHDERNIVVEAGQLQNLACKNLVLGEKKVSPSEITIELANKIFPMRSIPFDSKHQNIVEKVKVLYKMAEEVGMNVDIRGFDQRKDMGSPIENYTSTRLSNLLTQDKITNEDIAELEADMKLFRTKNLKPNQRIYAVADALLSYGDKIAEPASYFDPFVSLYEIYPNRYDMFKPKSEFLTSDVPNKIRQQISNYDNYLEKGRKYIAEAIVENKILTLSDIYQEVNPQSGDIESGGEFGDAVASTVLSDLGKEILNSPDKIENYAKEYALRNINKIKEKIVNIREAELSQDSFWGYQSVEAKNKDIEKWAKKLDVFERYITNKEPRVEKAGLMRAPAAGGMIKPETPTGEGQKPEIPKEAQVEAEAQKEPVLAVPEAQGGMIKPETATGEGILSQAKKKANALADAQENNNALHNEVFEARKAFEAGTGDEKAIEAAKNKLKVNSVSIVELAKKNQLTPEENEALIDWAFSKEGNTPEGKRIGNVIQLLQEQLSTPTGKGQVPEIPKDESGILPQEPAAAGEYAKQYEQDYLGQYDELSPEDRARFDLEMDDLRNRPEANLLVAIRKLGKIKIERNAAGMPSERFKDLPASIKDKNSSQTLDGIRTELETFGWYFDDEAEFFDAIKTAAVNQEKPADRAELRRIIREAEKNKKLQQIINDKFKKTRKFIKTVKQSEKTAPEVAAKVKSLYDPITNAETLKQAQEYIAASPEDALQLVEGPGKPTAFSNAVAIVLIDKAQAEGRYSDAIRLVEKTAEKQTSLGQAIQALSMYNRLTPEGILQAAAKIVREGREAITQKDRLTKFDKQSEKLTDKEKAVLAKRLGVPFLSEEEAAKIHDMAVKMADWPDPPPFDAPPANAYQYWIDEFQKLLDAPEGLSAKRKQALQLAFDEFQKLLPDTGGIGPGQQGYQFVIDEFQKLLDAGDEMGPVTEGVQEVMNIASQRISRAKRLETLLLLKRLQSLVPPSRGKKIAMVQTLSQLLNPKTIIRNLFGNLGFMGLENISDTIGTAIDMAACKFTGERTQYLPSGAAQVKGGIQGIKEGTEEALLGVSLSKHGTKFDLPANGVYDKGVMGALEKTLRLVLAAPDQAFFQAAFNQCIYNDTKAAGITEPTDEMLERAVLLGLYRTYQDDSVIAKQFVRLKKWMNDWTGGDFGFGDMIIKYPKTPACILSRGIEYSPFSLIKAIHYLALPLIGRDFRQRDFVKASSRGFTGSALLVGIGAFLASFKIISGSRAKDKDVEATRANVGIREYQLNASALKRFVMSGMDPEQSKIKEDDIHVTYDWFQPQSIGLALGANMVLDPKSNLVDRTLNLGDRLLAASETLQEQPLMQGMRVLTSRENIAQGLSDVAKGAPASMMPTLLNNVRQLTDNTVRNTKDPNFLKEVYNKIIVRIPGLSYTLPPRITTLGQERAAYQFGSNNPFNVFLNPAFVTTYKPDPVSKMVLDIWESTGETIHFPRVAAVKIKLGGNTAEPAELTPEQYTEYQKYIGCRTDVLFSILAEKPEFMALPDDKKAKVLQGYLTDINSAAKKNILMLGYRPETDTLTILKSIGRDKRKLDALGVPDENLGFIEKK